MNCVASSRRKSRPIRPSLQTRGAATADVAGHGTSNDLEAGARAGGVVGRRGGLEAFDGGVGGGDAVVVLQRGESWLPL